MDNDDQYINKRLLSKTINFGKFWSRKVLYVNEIC